VFDDRVLRRIFGPRRDEVTREWRRLHNEENYDTFSSTNIIRVIKSRIINEPPSIYYSWILSPE
jgi:hypothetical protein